MGTDNLDFAKGVAMVLRGENMKASCYVTHGQSLGVLRERMVRTFIRGETPDRFQLGTGFIHDNKKPTTSAQIDLLVHDSQQSAPLYRWEDFVVVAPIQAKAAIEVKSQLDKNGIERLIRLHSSVAQIELDSGAFIPTFGYALDGASFETFVKHLSDAIRQNAICGETAASKLMNAPVCIAVENQHYVSIRPLHFVVDPPPYLFAVDLTKMRTECANDLVGIETGLFLQFYCEILQNRWNSLPDCAIYEWFNKIPVDNSGKVFIDPDGNVHRGKIPSV